VGCPCPSPPAVSPVFSLLRCRFCGDDIDAADLLLQDGIDRITQVLLPASSEELLPPLEEEFV
jgi:hypothetical protein